jgi:hypothetical protein
VGRKSNYEKDIFKQLNELMSKVDTLESGSKQNRNSIKTLNSEVSSLRKENSNLRDEVVSLKQENISLNENCNALTKENGLLRNDNERMKRILNNDSSNSSTPPSQDNPGKPANSYNSRKPTDKKKGAQIGHKGHGLSKSDVEDKIKKGVFQHRIKEIGTFVPGRAYVTRYKLDLEVQTVATEYRIYTDENGKFYIPNELKGDVFYGENIKAIAAFLYSEGVVANDRICTFINSLSGDSLEISTGCIYNACNAFSEKCEEACQRIENNLLNADEICTDATPVKTDGKLTYIRNFSTAQNVLYCSSEKKDLETLSSFSILKKYTGILTHDHETALYHFGTEHVECNVHMERYLLKNTEETSNKWSHDLTMFFEGLNHTRNEQKEKNETCFSKEQLNRYSNRYDQILADGIQANKKTKGRLAKKEEKTLLNRLMKYKKNHLLFLYDFRVHYSNNMSEKDLRICKNRQKMAGGFRTASGRNMYCRIISFIETVKRRSKNIFQSIKELMAGQPVIQ